MPLRMPRNPDRRAGAGEDDPVGRDRLARLDRYPPLVAFGLEADHLAGNDLCLGSLGNLAQVCAPLSVCRSHAPTVDPVGVRAAGDQVPLPAEFGHSGGNGRR